MRRTLGMLLLASCGGGTPAVPDAGLDAREVTAVPLLVYTDCLADRPNNPIYREDQCLRVEVRSGGTTLVSEWLQCGDFCDEALGFGVGPIGFGGAQALPLLLRCAPVGAPVEVSVCITGYRPLDFSMEPRPDRTSVAQDLDPQVCPPAEQDHIVASHAVFQVTYELTPADGGVACPPRPPDAGPGPALFCPCP